MNRDDRAAIDVVATIEQPLLRETCFSVVRSWTKRKQSGVAFPRLCHPWSMDPLSISRALDFWKQIDNLNPTLHEEKISDFGLGLAWHIKYCHQGSRFTFNPIPKNNSNGDSCMAASRQLWHAFVQQEKCCCTTID